MHDGWTFQQAGKQQWYRAEVPGTVHTDLLREGLIPDPMRNNNVDSVQWIENEDWVYRCTISVHDSLFNQEHIDLVFRGLDTFAEVYLNDSLLGKADNMFRSWEWSVKKRLKPGDNELKVIFLSAIKEGAKLRDAYGIQLPHDNDPSGVSPYVRKAAYQFGWDFAPPLVGCGIWREVELRCWSKGSGTGTIGSNPLAKLEQGPDSLGERFGFIRASLGAGSTPLFMKGCNLVPPNAFPSQRTDQDWQQLVNSMKAVGMNMVRVWAGGVYPPEKFLHSCDSAGILVWQDLMFANLVPGDAAYKLNALTEAKEQRRRLNDHPSVVLICGNNELDVAWKNWGWQSTYTLGPEEQRRIEAGNSSFFNEDLKKSSPNGPPRSYTPTSPLSNWGNAEGLNSGDLHYWGVWHGDSAFSSFANNVGRFVSEYGFQSYPDSITLAHYIDPEFLYLGSPMLAKRQRSYKTDKPIWTAIEREFGEKPTTLGRFIDCSQAVQAEAYRQAIWAHRTNQPHCMGTLYWQLNDVWAAPTWSTLDVDLRWKAAHFEVKRSYAERVLAFVPGTDGSVQLELWSDSELQGDSVTIEFWSVQGELLKTEVERPSGKGLIPLMQWPRGQWPAGIAAYAYGAGASPRMHAPGSQAMGSAGPHVVRLEGDFWEVRSAVPLRTVKVITGPDDRPSENWFPLVPGHPVQFSIEHGVRSVGVAPQVSTFLR